MKYFMQSKTLWFNLIAFIVGLVGDLTGALHFNEGTLKIFSVVVIVGNAILRFGTTQPITVNKQP